MLFRRCLNKGTLSSFALRFLLDIWTDSTHWFLFWNCLIIATAFGSFFNFRQLLLDFARRRCHWSLKQIFSTFLIILIPIFRWLKLLSLSGSICIGCDLKRPVEVDVIIDICDWFAAYLLTTFVLWIRIFGATCRNIHSDCLISASYFR